MFFKIIMLLQKKFFKVTIFESQPFDSALFQIKISFQLPFIARF